MANDYLIHDHKNGGFMDALIALAREQLFIEYPDHHVTHLPVRLYRFWIRLVSFLLTQFLHRVEKPMCHLGYCIEQILNLLSHNGGLLGIIFRVLTGPNILSHALLSFQLIKIPF